MSGQFCPSIIFQNSLNDVVMSHKLPGAPALIQTAGETKDNYLSKK